MYMTDKRNVKKRWGLKTSYEDTKTQRHISPQAIQKIGAKWNFWFHPICHQTHLNKIYRTKES